MPLLHAPHPLRRTTLWVLLAWLCVLAASVGAPLARANQAAQSVERLCSGEPVPQWAPSPIAHAHEGGGDVAALHHVIDCALCLPVLLAPPGAWQAQLHALPQQSHSALVPAPRIAQASHWPPARGPPA